MCFGQFLIQRHDIICLSYLVSHFQKVRKETRCLWVNFDVRDKIEFVSVNLSLRSLLVNFDFRDKIEFV